MNYRDAFTKQKQEPDVARGCARQRIVAPRQTLQADPKPRLNELLYYLFVTSFALCSLDWHAHALRQQKKGNRIKESTGNKLWKKRWGWNVKVGGRR